MVVLVNAFRIVVHLCLWLELIHYLLWFLRLSFRCSLLLTFNRNIIDIHIPCLLILRALELSLALHGLLLLGELHLLNQLLLIDLHLRLQVNHLHIRILPVLVKHLPLVLLQPLLRMLVLRMDRSQSTVKFFLAVLQSSVVYPCIVFVQGWQLLVPNRSFLKIARERPRGCGSGVGRLRSGLSGCSYRSNLLIVTFLVLLLVIAGPLIYLIQKLQLVLGVGYAGDFAHHFEQPLHVILPQCKAIGILLLVVVLNDLFKLLELGVIVKQERVDGQETVLLFSDPLLPFDQLDVLL